MYAQDDGAGTAHPVDRRVMAVEGRTRRFVPAVLMCLALLLGLPAAGTAAFARAGARPPAGTTAVPAAPAADALAARRGSGGAAQTRGTWHRPAGGTSPLPAALLTVAVFAAAPFVRRLRFRPGQAGPGGRGRFTYRGRAPPREVRPA